MAVIPQGNLVTIDIPANRGISVRHAGETTVSSQLRILVGGHSRTITSKGVYNQRADDTPSSIQIHTVSGSAEYEFPYPAGGKIFAVVTFTGNRTLRADDVGKILRCDDNDSVTVTVPAGLPVGFNCVVAAWGTGTVTLAGEGATNRSNGDELSTQYGAGSVMVVGDDEFITGGDFA